MPRNNKIVPSPTDEGLLSPSPSISRAGAVASATAGVHIASAIAVRNNAISKAQNYDSSERMESARLRQDYNVDLGRDVFISSSPRNVNPIPKPSPFLSDELLGSVSANMLAATEKSKQMSEPTYVGIKRLLEAKLSSMGTSLYSEGERVGEDEAEEYARRLRSRNEKWYRPKSAPPQRGSHFFRTPGHEKRPPEVSYGHQQPQHSGSSGSDNSREAAVALFQKNRAYDRENPPPLGHYRPRFTLQETRPRSADFRSRSPTQPRKRDLRVHILIDRADDGAPRKGTRPSSAFVARPRDPGFKPGPCATDFYTPDVSPVKPRPLGFEMVRQKDERLRSGAAVESRGRLFSALPERTYRNAQTAFTLTRPNAPSAVPFHLHLPRGHGQAYVMQAQGNKLEYEHNLVYPDADPVQLEAVTRRVPVVDLHRMLPRDSPPASRIATIGAAPSSAQSRTAAVDPNESLVRSRTPLTKFAKQLSREAVYESDSKQHWMANTGNLQRPASAQPLRHNLVYDVQEKQTRPRSASSINYAKMTGREDEEAARRVTSTNKKGFVASASIVHNLFRHETQVRLQHNLVYKPRHHLTSPRTVSPCNFAKDISRDARHIALTPKPAAVN